MNNISSEMKLLKYIGNGLSGLGTLFTILSFYGYSASGHKIWYLFLGIILCSLTISIFILRKKISKHILVFILNRTVSNPNIEIVNKIVRYEHIERYKFKFQSTFSIKVVGNTPISSHTERLKWTAGFISDIMPTQPNQHIEYDKNPLSHNCIDKQNFKIIFPNEKSITKSDKPYKTGFKILNLVDEKHISKPILVVGIYNVTKNLTLKVYFDKTLHPIELRGLKYAHFIDEKPYDSVSLELKYDVENHKNYVEFNIKTPIYGGKYAIDWNFED